MSPRYNSAERMGRWLGRAWRGLVRQTQRSRHWMVQAGLSESVANGLIVLTSLAAAGAALYCGLWVLVVATVLLFLLSVGVPELPNSVADEPEWRDGHAGHGLYDVDGFRVDPYDPDKVEGKGT